METLLAEGIGKSYKGRQVVRGVDLKISRGEVVGLLGPNGAGKTTFVKILVSAVLPTAGSARLFGRDATDPEARRPVGYLPENHRFPTYLTARGMLDFYSALSGVDARERKRRIPELLDLVGLKNWGDIRIKKFSKGMLQRLGLAQALIHRPRLLLLDEPTDGVDPVGRRDIRDILDRLTGTGVTVFINSHLLSEVETFCEYVAILRRGELALQGKISSLVAGRGYRIACSPLPAPAMEKLRELAASLSTTEDGVEIQAENADLANQAIDIIRATGGLVESVNATSSSLEDVFIRVTRSGKAA